MRHLLRTTVATQMNGFWFHSRHKGCSYPSKKTVCQSDPWLQRYKLAKSVTGSCRAAHTQFCPLLTKKLRSALRAPLVIKVTECVWLTTTHKFSVVSASGFSPDGKEDVEMVIGHDRHPPSLSANYNRWAPGVLPVKTSSRSSTTPKREQTLVVLTQPRP